MALFNITTAELQKSATTYRRDLLIMPVIAASDTLKHFTAHPGVAGREVIGQFSGDVQLGPYDPSRTDTTGVNVSARTLETWLGSVIKRFDVNEAGRTVWGVLTAQGESLKNSDLALQVLNYLSAKLGKSLNLSLWSAKRNDSGTTTADLFNGFDTITQDEITAGTISTSTGNLQEFSAAITSTNAVDTLLDFYQKASDELQNTPTKLFMPSSVYNAYCRDYAVRFGANPYNTQYNKTFLEGSQQLCELVPLASKKGSDFLHLSTRGNMVYGYGCGLADENIAIEKYHEFLLSFVATMYFGCQFESISPEVLCIGKLHA